MIRIASSSTKPLTTFLVLLMLGGMKAWSADPPPPADAAWGPVTEGIQMWARPRKALYNADEVMFLDVSVRYTSPKASPFVEESDPQSEFDITVKDGKGKTVPDTRAGGAHTSPLNGLLMRTRRVGIRLKPGQTATYHFWVNHMYDMSLDGTYYVTVQRSVQKMEGQGSAEVISNTAAVRVGWPPHGFDDPETNLEIPSYSLPPGVAEPDKKQPASQ